MQIPETKDVLIVDDDRSIRGLIAVALNRHGLRCDTAGGGAEGIEMIAHTTYSVVVVDLMMPLIDGVAFIKILRNREAKSSDRPVVLLMTAFPLQDVPELGNEVQALVAKPFDVIELANLIRDCVETQRRHHDSQNAVGSADSPADVSATPPRPFDAK